MTRGKQCRKCGADDWAHQQNKRWFYCRSCMNARVAEMRRTDPVRNMLTNVKHRARKSGIPFALSVADIEIPTHCPVLGIPLVPSFGRGRGSHDDIPTLDRFDPDVGYVPGNVSVISSRANRLKSDATPAELKRLAEWAEARAK